LRLEVLFSDEPVKDVTAFKQSFLAPKMKGELVHEFLYLQGSNNRWTWGRTGGVNGPLLWPPALEFFLQAIMPSLGWSLASNKRKRK
jgi:hypothetical protein